MPKSAPVYNHLDIRGLSEQEQALRKAVELNIPALLIGETGTGKTSLVKKVAQEHKQKVVRVNLNGQTSIDEFVGKYILQNGEMVWQDGTLVTCLRNGYWLLVDEINAALPEILFVLHSALDDDRSVLLAEKDGELVTAHEDFRLFASMNPVDEYAGTKELNKALLSRFGVVLNVPYVSFDTEVAIVTDRTGLDFVTAKKICTFAIATRNLKKDEKIFNCMSTRDVLGIAQLITNNFDPDNATKVVYFNKLSKDELNVVLTATGFAKGKSSDFILGGVDPYYTKKEVDESYTKGKTDEENRTKDIVKELKKQITLLKGINKGSEAVEAEMVAGVGDLKDLPF